MSVLIFSHIALLMIINQISNIHECVNHEELLHDSSLMENFIDHPSSHHIQKGTMTIENHSFESRTSCAEIQDDLTFLIKLKDESLYTSVEYFEIISFNNKFQNREHVYYYNFDNCSDKFRSLYDELMDEKNVRINYLMNTNETKIQLVTYFIPDFGFYFYQIDYHLSDINWNVVDTQKGHFCKFGLSLYEDDWLKWVFVLYGDGPLSFTPGDRIYKHHEFISMPNYLILGNADLDETVFRHHKLIKDVIINPYIGTNSHFELKINYLDGENLHLKVDVTANYTSIKVFPLDLKSEFFKDGFLTMLGNYKDEKYHDYDSIESRTKVYHIDQWDNIENSDIYVFSYQCQPTRDNNKPKYMIVVYYNIYFQRNIKISKFTVISLFVITCCLILLSFICYCLSKFRVFLFGEKEIQKIINKIEKEERVEKGVDLICGFMTLIFSNVIFVIIELIFNFVPDFFIERVIMTVIHFIIFVLFVGLLTIYRFVKICLQCYCKIRKEYREVNLCSCYYNILTPSLNCCVLLIILTSLTVNSFILIWEKEEQGQLTQNLMKWFNFGIIIFMSTIIPCIIGISREIKKFSDLDKEKQSNGNDNGLSKKLLPKSWM